MLSLRSEKKPIVADPHQRYRPGEGDLAVGEAVAASSDVRDSQFTDVGEMQPGVRVRQHLLNRALALLAAALMFVGCSTLPLPAKQQHSLAVRASAFTDLGADVHSRFLPGESGYALISDNSTSLQARLELFGRAEHSVDLQYFSWNSDDTGRQVLKAVADAAHRGVRVRLLLDDLQSHHVEQHLVALAIQANVEVRLFNPFTVRGPIATRLVGSLTSFSRVRHRMHNKLLVVDNIVAITGGRNVGNQYLGPTGEFFDVDVLVAGGIVPELSEGFDDYWNSDYAYPLAQLIPSVVGAGESWLRGEAHKWTGPRSALSNLVTCAGARAFVDPVEKVAGFSIEDSSATVHERLLHLFAVATHEAVIASPYFVRGSDGLKRIRSLVGRGVQAQVLTNSLSSTDERLAHIVYMRYRRQLLETGLTIREFASPERGDDTRSKTLHAKLAVVDRRYLYVGSLNFTNRSERLNTEVGLILDCPVLAQQAFAIIQGVPAYELRLEKPFGTKWVRKTPSGPERIWHREPDSTLWQRLLLALANPFIPEEEI